MDKQVPLGADVGFGYSVGLSPSIGALIGIGLMFRVFAVVALALKVRPRAFIKGSPKT